jgi:hypothetical protein
MLLETMVDVGWWLMIIGAKSLSIFCTFKKSAQNHNEKRDQQKSKPKKRDQEVSFFLILCHL